MPRRPSRSSRVGAARSSTLTGCSSWREAIATRHRITHGYDVVDYDILWDTVQDDLPPLVRALEEILADLA